jgi:hypothetical protein
MKRLNTIREKGDRVSNLDSDAKRRRFPRSKNPSALSDGMTRALNGYAWAAAAAGVSILACASPAEAEPVCGTLYVTLKQTNTIPFNPAGMAVAPFNVAQTTFQYFLSTTGVSSWRWWNRAFFTPNSGPAKVVLGPNNLPAALQSGSVIGPADQFGKAASYGMLFTYGKGNFSVRGGGTKSNHRGNLNLLGDSFVGFQFSQSGKSHYGWLRLSVGFHGTSIKETLLNVLNYGYESAPDTSINAGTCSGGEESAESARGDVAEGASLGMLALGSGGLDIWK